MIEIKHIDGKVLYTVESAQDVRAAVVEATSRRAYLSGADLRRADLSGADLSGADDDPNIPFFAIRQDVWSILDRTPAEVAALRAALVAGQVDGSTYSGTCRCLVGTIAKARGVEAEESAEMGEALGIVCDSSRLAEQWFGPIRPGQIPVPLEELTKDTLEGVFRASVAVAWVDAWTESRTRIAAALDTQAA